MIATLNFVLASERKSLDLDGVPLLVTEDQKLRRFQRDNEIFPARWSNILKKRPELFIIRGYKESLIPKPFLRKLTADSLVKYLRLEQIPQLTRREQEALSLELMKFVTDTCHTNSKRDYLNKFGEFSLLPVTINGEEQFVRLEEVSNVLFPINSTYEHYDIQEIFSILGSAGYMILNLNLNLTPESAQSFLNEGVPPQNH